MTKGEKMIWAAKYANCMSEAHYCDPVTAARRATFTVLELRGTDLETINAHLPEIAERMKTEMLSDDGPWPEPAPAAGEKAKEKTGE